ncbi:MAG TPA: hypothetical protein VIY27_11210 [Myxococcota bacterium]
MKLIIIDEIGKRRRVSDPDVLDAARELAEDVLDQDDPLDAPIEPQGVLVRLAKWVAWQAQLALACAEACGCVVYLDDQEDETAEATVLELVGVAEDAEATRRVWRRMLRSVKRTLGKECAGRSDEWTERWAAEHVGKLDDDIEHEADKALERAYRSKLGKGASLVFDEEGEPADRAAAARAWLQEELALDEIAVVPTSPASADRKVVDLAAYAARRSS